MTPRFRALLKTAALFAVIGIPVGVVDALLAAWRASQELPAGLGYWPLVASFAIDSVRMFMIIFAMVGMVFGLWLSVADLPVSRRHAVGRGIALGILAGIVTGIAAYAFGGWGSGESALTWLAGASSLAALSATVGGATAAAAFRIADRARPLPPPVEARLPPTTEAE